MFLHGRDCILIFEDFFVFKITAKLQRILGCVVHEIAFVMEAVEVRTDRVIPIMVRIVEERSVSRPRDLKVIPFLNCKECIHSA